MSAHRGPEPLNYHRVGRADLGAIARLDLDPDQMERFFDPLDVVIAAVRAGSAHTLIAIEADAKPIGFYALHPDRRDASCWWLGWFALQRRQQGRGYGRRVMARIMACLGRIPHCRRVRLLVTPDNAPALRLYASMGFRRIGMNAPDEIIMEAVLGGYARRDSVATLLRRPSSHARRASQIFRRRLWPVAHEVRAIAIERGPPRSYRPPLTGTTAPVT